MMTVLTGYDLQRCINRILSAGLYKDLGRLGYDDQAVATSLIARGVNVGPIISITLDPAEE